MQIEKLSQVLERRCKLSIGDKLLVGVSGGPDSLALLDALVRLGYSVMVAYYDHGLREQASEELEYVRQIAEQYGLPFVSDEGDTHKYARKHRMSIEEAARELRYRFLFETAKQTEAVAVLVGHNADDQVETVVMHLMRGAGLDGLSGMRYRVFSGWSPDIPLVRPLLGTWRDEINQYCDDRGLKPSFDQSNLDVTFFRNRLRRELIPALEEYNSSFKTLIWKMSETISEDRVVLDSMVEDELEGLLLERSESLIALDRQAFSKLKIGLQRRLLRKVISVLRPGLKDIGYDAIEQVILLLNAPPISRQANLFSGLKIEIEDDRLVLSDWEVDPARDDWPQLLPGQEFEHFIPGVSEIDAGWKFISDIMDATPELISSLSANQDLFTAYLDLTTCGDHLLIRSRQPGDRFKPLGMGGNSAKISDFMINEKLPKRARPRWPLVFSKSKMIWVPGFQISDDVKVRETTEKVVRICLVRHNS